MKTSSPSDIWLMEVARFKYFSRVAAKTFPLLCRLRKELFQLREHVPRYSCDSFEFVIMPSLESHQPGREILAMFLEEGYGRV